MVPKPEPETAPENGLDNRRCAADVPFCAARLGLVRAAGRVSMASVAGLVWGAAVKVNYRIFKRVSLVVMLLMTFVGLSTSEAQTAHITGTLFYHRKNGTTTEYVRLSAVKRQVYTLPPGKCTLLSPNGFYTAESSWTKDDLVIRHFDTREIVAHMPWREDWDACYMGWISDTQIGIRGLDKNWSYFDFSSGILQVFNLLPTPLKQYPALPGYIPSTLTDYILPSPQSDIYLYERCNTDEVVETGERCLDTDFVIYDAANHIALHVLENADETMVRDGFDVYLQLWHPSAGTTWSASGRYLAFQRYSSGWGDRFTISIYDLIATKYLNTDFFNSPLDPYKKLDWSPAGEKLAFWVIGHYGAEPEPTDNENTRNLAFYDASTEGFVNGGVFEVTGKPGIWSPDGQSYAFVDDNGYLRLVDVITGENLLLDTNVDEIKLWRPD